MNNILYILQVLETFA